MQADPTFWLAYARHVFARYWSVSSAADSVVISLRRHRLELPERERLSTDAILLITSDSLELLLERARAAGERYPNSWFGWLIYGDAVLHNGPLLGRSREEGRRAFERALELNPGLIPAWEHLMLVALLDGDTTAAAVALRSLDSLGAGPTLSADGYGDRMLQFRYLDAALRGDSALVRILTDSLGRDVALAAVPDGSFYDPYRHGFFARQVAVSRAALAAGGPPEWERMHRLLLALSWGGRGAWDSALAGLDRLAAEDPDADAALRAYGVAAQGAWLDALDPAVALARRPAAAEAASRSGVTGASELAWLDAVLAVARKDRGGVAEARVALRRSRDPAWTSLDRSLGAFDAALQGDIRRAGETMADLEWEQAKWAAPAFRNHPLVIATDRLAAARWLASTGDTEQARRLLEWVEGPYLLHPSMVYSLMFAGLADLERGRIERQRGHAEQAGRYYRRFLQRYDRAPARQAPLVKEARARVSSAP
jgi:tetratricopeptide (TPR) repeat protein